MWIPSLRCFLPHMGVPKHGAGRQSRSAQMLLLVFSYRLYDPFVSRTSKGSRPIFLCWRFSKQRGFVVFTFEERVTSWHPQGSLSPSLEGFVCAQMTLLPVYKTPLLSAGRSFNLFVFSFSPSAKCTCLLGLPWGQGDHWYKSAVSPCQEQQLCRQQKGSLPLKMLSRFILWSALCNDFKCALSRGSQGGLGWTFEREFL